MTGVSWRIMLKLVLKEYEWEGMDEVSPTQDRDKWRAVLSTVLVRRFKKSLGNLLTNFS